MVRASGESLPCAGRALEPGPDDPADSRGRMAVAIGPPGPMILSSAWGAALLPRVRGPFARHRRRASGGARPWEAAPLLGEPAPEAHRTAGRRVADTLAVQPADDRRGGPPRRREAIPEPVDHPACHRQAFVAIR